MHQSSPQTRALPLCQQPAPLPPLITVSDHFIHHHSPYIISAPILQFITITTSRNLAINYHAFSSASPEIKPQTIIPSWSPPNQETIKLQQLNSQPSRPHLLQTVAASQPPSLIISAASQIHAGLVPAQNTTAPLSTAVVPSSRPFSLMPLSVAPFNPKRPASLHHRHDLITPSLPRRRAKLDSQASPAPTVSSHRRRSNSMTPSPSSIDPSSPAPHGNLSSLCSDEERKKMNKKKKREVKRSRAEEE
jgi:hypothetical protein